MNTAIPASTPTDRRRGRTSPQTRVPIKRTAASILAALLIAIIGFAAVQPTQPAEAQSTTSLVANTGSGNNQSQFIDTISIDRWAQGFTTGIAGGGYVPGSVGLRHSGTDSNASPGDLEVTVNEVAANGHPGDALCRLKNPPSFQRYAVNTFKAPTAGDGPCPILTPNTTYFVVIERVAGTTAIRLTKTFRNDEDSGAHSQGLVHR